MEAIRDTWERLILKMALSAVKKTLLFKVRVFVLALYAFPCPFTLPFPVPKGVSLNAHDRKFALFRRRPWLFTEWKRPPEAGSPSAMPSTVTGGQQDYLTELQI